MNMHGVSRYSRDWNHPVKIQSGDTFISSRRQVAISRDIESNQQKPMDSVLKSREIPSSIPKNLNIMIRINFSDAFPDTVSALSSASLSLRLP